MFSKYRDSSRPGRPAGAEIPGDEDILEGWEFKRHMAHLPWADEDQCEACKLTRARGYAACRDHSLGPKVIVPGGPAPDADLPCVGRHKLFDLDRPTDAQWAEIEELCGGCPFKDWCLETATANDEYGIWAATSREERAAIRRRKVRAS